MKSSNIMIAMSGGVDSSVSALMLQEQSYDIAGMFMKNWEENDVDDDCPATQDVFDARQVANLLNIRLYTRNFSQQYWKNVFTNFLEEIKAGRTPNPDIICNKEIKFKTFIEHAKALGADHIATGHYVQKIEQDGLWLLKKGRDFNKDQSYFLYALNQEQLAVSLFPIGHLLKPEVRKKAQQAQFPVSDKKDSTGICFIGEKQFQLFLANYIKPNPGLIKDDHDRIVGEHQGVIFYTLGQRKGLGIGGKANSEELPWYVIDKDLTNNELIVGQGHDHPRLFSKKLFINQLTWIAGEPIKLSDKLTAKIRYRQQDQICKIEQLNNDCCEAIFDQPQRAATPGQSIVFYQDDICLGGGIIDHVTA